MAVDEVLILFYKLFFFSVVFAQQDAIGANRN